MRSPSFLEKLRSRDNQAITVVVEKYTEHLLKTALSMGFPRDIAQDIVQNSMITFFDVVHKFEGRAHVRTFLFGILYNKIREARRVQAKSNLHDPIDEIMESKFDDSGRWINTDLDPLKFMEKCETLEIIEECLKKLPIAQKMAFTLNLVQGEDAKDVCNILEVSYTNFRQLLYRGRNHLRLCVESYLKE